MSDVEEVGLADALHVKETTMDPVREAVDDRELLLVMLPSLLLVKVAECEVVADKDGVAVAERANDGLCVGKRATVIEDVVLCESQREYEAVPETLRLTLTGVLTLSDKIDGRGLGEIVLESVILAVNVPVPLLDVVVVHVGVIVSVNVSSWLSVGEPDAKDVRDSQLSLFDADPLLLTEPAIDAENVVEWDSERCATDRLAVWLPEPVAVHVAVIRRGNVPVDVLLLVW